MVRTVVMYIILDHSGSMVGQEIGAANDIVANLTQQFQSESQTYPEINAKLRILGFGTELKMLADKSPDTFIWEDVNGNGLTNIGSAFIYLNKTIKSDDDNILILISDGGFTDEYFNALSELMNNRAFPESQRISISTGGKYDSEQLSFFCGSMNNVVTIDQIDRINNIISQTFTICKTNNQKTSMLETSDNWE